MPFARFRVVQISGWKLVLGAVLLGALLFALFILAAGIFLLVLPVAAIVGAFAYLFGSRTKARDFPGEDFSGGVIETEYREVEQKQLEQDRK